MNLPESIRDALAKADTYQLESWLDMPHFICGIEIKQMTIQHYYMLSGIDSPFLTGENYYPGDIGIFLWLLSPEYKICQKAKKAFAKKIKDIKIAQAETEINKYLEITFNDLDTLQEENNDKKYAGYLAYQIDLYAKEYGWSIDEILKIPLRQCFQLNTAIAERNSRQAGKKYTKMRAVDVMEARAILDMAKSRKIHNN